jgi:hypothetical protein
MNLSLNIQTVVWLSQNWAFNQMPIAEWSKVSDIKKGTQNTINFSVLYVACKIQNNNKTNWVVEFNLLTILWYILPQEINTT